MYYRESDPEERGLGCRGKLIILAVVFLILVALGFTAVMMYHEVFDSTEGGDYIIVDVPEGSSTQSIASQLKQEGLIRSELAFRVFSRITRSDGKYQCGKHKLQMGRSYSELIRELSSTTYAEVETLTVSFPEGTTALAMAIKLENARLCKIDEFIAKHR